MATTVIAHDDTDIEYSGTWSAVSGFQETTQIGATLRFEFLGNTDVELTMGEGDDHSIYDVYVNETLWQSYDGYASSSGERVIDIPLTNDGVNVLEVRNTMDVNSGSSGRKVRFKQLSVDTDVTMQEIIYTYDAIERLLEADYIGSTRNYKYTYDLAGNRLSEQVNGGAITSYTYNNANQLTGDGTNTYTYDNNGNLTSDGTNTHTWDRANRLLSVGNHSYAYDGNGARIQKTVSSVVTDYLLDVNQGLTQVLRESDGSNTQHYIHSPRGIHAMNDGSNWSYMLQDGLGSVRAEIAQNVAINGSQSYAPYGEVFGASGAMSSPFAFTGEPLDGNGLQYHRARYMNPALGGFLSLDPFEGVYSRPMSLNGYSWVEGNPVMWTDPNGRQRNPDDGGAPMPVVGRVIAGGRSIPVSPNIYSPHTVNNVNIGITSQRPGSPLAPTGNYTNVARVIINDPIVIKEPAFLPAIDIAYNSRFISGSAIARHFNGQVGAIFNVSGQNMWTVCGSVDTCSAYVTQLTNQEAGTETSVTPATYTSYATGLQTFADFYNSLSPEELAKVCNTACHPQVQTNTSTQTQYATPQPTPTPKQCDPQKVREWLSRNQPKPETRKGDEYDYQRKHCGQKYDVIGNGEKVEADGIRVEDCTLLDAKYVRGKSQDSMYVFGSNRRMVARNAGFLSNIDNQEDDLFRRYGEVLRASQSENPFTGLEIITNDGNSQTYWEFWINRWTVPNAYVSVK